MKKIFFISAIAAVMFGLTSCDDKDEPSQNPDNPTHSTGAYFLCQGQAYNHVPGGLFALDYTTGKWSDNAFQTANGISLGDTPQWGICYGSKLYLGIFDSNVIHIVDKYTFKNFKTISLKDSKNGQKPRSLVAKDGKVYIAMYDGYVARLDTLSMDIEASVKVGPNPEVIGIYKDELYVPNSNGEDYPNYGTTASVVNLKDFSVTKTIDVPMNPYMFRATDQGLFLLCKGNYEDIASQVYKMNGDKWDAVANATIMAADKDKLYLVDDPFYGSVPAEYRIYDCVTNKVVDWNIEKVIYPNNIAVDRIGGRIFISSYYMDGKYPSFKAPGYVSVYGLDNSFISKHDIGTGSPCIFFDHE